MATPRRSTRFALMAVAGIASAMLAACGSDGGGEDASTAVPTVTVSPTESPIGGDVLPPVMVAEDETSVTAKVGDTIVFDVEDPVNTRIDTEDTSLLELTQGYVDGGATFNPGAKALAPGTAVVSVSTPDDDTYEVSVTIE